MTTKIFEPKINCSGSGGGGGDGVDTFIELTDTPSGYGGQENKTVVVNPSGNGLTFVDSPSGGSGNSNVFKINAGQTYTVESTQELVSTGLFYLDGEMVLDGKWALLGESVNLGGSSFGDGDDDHTHSDLIQLAEFNMVPDGNGGYMQNIYHTLQGFPLLKFITSNLKEVHPVVRHVTTGHFVIEANVSLSGKIYALHSSQTRVPVLFGALALSPSGGEYVQFIHHNTNSFPFFKIMDGNGSELMLEMEHISPHITKIKSNLAVSGQIYMI